MFYQYKHITSLFHNTVIIYARLFPAFDDNPHGSWSLTLVLSRYINIYTVIKIIIIHSLSSFQYGFNSFVYQNKKSEINSTIFCICKTNFKWTLNILSIKAWFVIKTNHRWQFHCLQGNPWLTNSLIHFMMFAGKSFQSVWGVDWLKGLQHLCTIVYSVLIIILNFNLMVIN